MAHRIKRSSSNAWFWGFYSFFFIFLPFMAVLVDLLHYPPVLSNLGIPIALILAITVGRVMGNYSYLTQSSIRKLKRFVIMHGITMLAFSFFVDHDEVILYSNKIFQTPELAYLYYGSVISLLSFMVVVGPACLVFLSRTFRRR